MTRQIRFKNLLKTALSLLLGRPFYAVLSLILCLVATTAAFSMQNLYAYDAEEIFARTVQKETYIMLTRSQRDNASAAYFKNSEINNLPQYEFSVGVKNTVSFYSSLEKKEAFDSPLCPYTAYAHGIGVLTQNQLENSSWKLTGKLPETDGEIVLTEYLAECIAYGNETTAESLLDRQIELDGIPYTVCGIVNTNFRQNKYRFLNGLSEDSLTERQAKKAVTLVNNLQDELENSPHAWIFVTQNNLLLYGEKDEDGAPLEKYKIIFAPVSKNAREAVRYIYKNYYDVGQNAVKFAFHFPSCNSQDQIISGISDLKTSFLVISVALTIFSLGLLSWFQTQSIAKKKGMIGIFRALGANKGSVFSIFIMELTAFGVIVFILSMIASSVVTSVVNAAFGCVVLYFSPLNTLALLLICLLVSILSGLLPSVKILKKEPVVILRKAKE